MSIEESFDSMELEKDDPNGHPRPIDKDDSMWSGDFGAAREQQKKPKRKNRETSVLSPMAIMEWRTLFVA